MVMPSMHALLSFAASAALSAASCGAFNPSPSSFHRTHHVLTTHHQSKFLLSRHIALTDEQPPADDVASAGPLELRLEAFASSGIESDAELPRVLEAVASVCEEYGMPLDTSNVQSSEVPSQPSLLPGVLGRVLVIHVHGLPSDFDADENELMTQLKIESSERIDNILYQEDAGNAQPILLSFRPDGDSATLGDVIEKEVSDYGLRDAVNDEGNNKKNDNSSFVPSFHVELDGAMVETIESPGQNHFDTSSTIVFDNILDDSLRQRLLNIVKGNSEDHLSADNDWDDAENGPDPTRWVRGGLMDVVAEGTENVDGEGPCWGLTDDAIMDICFTDHPAIAEFESKLAQLFPDFIVSRLPEAVLGGCVSPLTANAPTHGDTFEYHIDADPLQVPPSPWADVFGRYPNRSKGKPRFVSCLLYLSDEWDAETWGAPTQFLDPPTQETYEVFPRPGRCIIMDQDISHTVVAPNAEAGKRPRYSLVWKLILHPKNGGQDMVDLSCGRKVMWPDSIVIGSANRIE